MAIAKPSNTALTAWGTRKDVRELAERLQMTMPGANKLTGSEAAALAQVAVAHGLDPFNGEIWLIKNKEGKALGLMVGIKGLRKLARRQLREESERAKLGVGAIYPAVMRKVEDVEAYGASKGDIVYRCELRDTVTLGAWLGNLVSLKATMKDITDVDAEKYIGPAPVTIGIGIWKAGENTKMKPDECARKRAEAHAIKQRFDVDFAQVSEEDGNIIEGQFTDVDEKESFLPEEREKPAPRTEAVIKRELGVEVPETLDEVQDRIRALAEHFEENPISVSEGMRGLMVGHMNTIFGNKVDRYLFTEAVTGHRSSKDVPDAYVVAVLTFFGLYVEGEELKRPIDANAAAVSTAKRLLVEIQKAHGQMELPK